MQLKNLGIVQISTKLIGNNVSDVNAVSAALKGIDAANSAAILSTTALSKSEKIAILVSKGLTQEKANEILATAALTMADKTEKEETNRLTAAKTKLAAATKGLWSVIKAHPFIFLAATLTTIISIVTNIIKKNKEAEREARQKAIEVAESAANLSNEISNLANEYVELSEAVKTDKSAKEQLLSTQNNLIDKLGVEKERLQELTKEYGNYSDAIKAASVESLQESERDLRAGVNAQKQELINIANPSKLLAKKNLGYIEAVISNSKENREEAHKAWIAIRELIHAGYAGKNTLSKLYYSEDKNGEYARGFGINLGIETTTIDGIKQAHKKLGEMLDIVADAKAEDTYVYDALYEKYNMVTTALKNYDNAIDSLNTNLAEQYALTELLGKEIPKTQEEFEEYRNKVIKEAIINQQFIGNQNDIERVIDNVLRSQTQFAEFYADTLGNLHDNYSDIRNIAINISETITSLEKFKSVAEGANKELEETGSISNETVKSIADLMDEGENYLNYLTIENGKLKLNTELWNSRATLSIENDIAILENELTELKKQNEEIVKQIALYQTRSKIINSTSISDPLGTGISAGSNVPRNNSSLNNAYSGMLKQKSNPLQEYFEAQNEVNINAQEETKKNIEVLKALLDGFYSDIDSKSSSKSEPKQYNWVETAIDRIKRKINSLSNTVSSKFKSLSKRNEAAKDEISETTKEIEIQEKAYKKYLKLAD